MEPSFRGQLGEKLTADLIREAADRRLTGVLRLSMNGTRKAVFFESGAPVFAISDAPNLRLEHRLTRDRLVTPALIEVARQRNSDPEQLGRTLVDIGVISDQALQQAAQDLAAQIIQSLFTWEQGDYEFDEGEPIEHDVKLDWSAADCILKGARHASNIESLVNAAAPKEKLLARASQDEATIGSSARLNPIEGFVLSSIASPTRVSEVTGLTGLPYEETQRAVFVLLALGLLVPGESKPEAEEQAAGCEESYVVTADSSAHQKPADKASDESADRVIAEISRKLTYFESVSYYEVLGVTKFATSSMIADAYRKLEHMFNSYRTLWPGHKILNERLDDLFARIEEAYDTLSDRDRRWQYDQPRDKRAAAAIIERGCAEDLERSRTRNPSPQFKGQGSVDDDASLEPMPGAVVISHPTRRPPFNPPESAEHYFRQGRARYEKNDFHAAAHLLREAVRLDSSRAIYHYYLGLTLSVLSRARRLHTHDEGCHVTCKLGGRLVRNQRVRHEAEQHLKTATQLDPTNAQTLLRLALLYKEAGMEGKAEQYFRETLILDGDNRIAKRELGMDDEAPIRRDRRAI